MKMIPGGQASEPQTVRHAGHEGREYKIKSEFGKQLRVRVFVLGKNRYLLGVLDDRGLGIEGKMVDPFFDSLKFLGETKPETKPEPPKSTPPDEPAK